MVRRRCELDYTPLYAGGRLPAMVTLTYPGDWLTVVPTGAALKKHMKALRKRYARAWGEDWACVWELEFQRRGAPHVHMLCTPPHGLSATTGERFALSLSSAWADVVAHPDPEQRRRQLAGTALDYAEGLRATNPRRVAAYFTKHGMMAAKEYQHDVPPEWSEPGTGPGRFWSVWACTAQSAPCGRVIPTDGIRAGRIALRWAKAQHRAQQTWKPRVEQATGHVRYRRARSRVRLMTNGNRGWVAVNAGAAFAGAMGAWLKDGQRAAPVARGRSGLGPRSTAVIATSGSTMW